MNARGLLLSGVPLKRILTQWNFKAKPVSPNPLNSFRPTDHVYLGNLPPSFTEKDVTLLVSPILGRTPNRIVLRQRSPGSQLHCFVWTDSITDARKIIGKLNGRIIFQFKIKVSNKSSIEFAPEVTNL